LAERGQVEEALAVFPGATGFGPFKLAEELARREDVEGLRREADAGHTHATYRLGELLANRGKVKEALPVLRRAADAGNQFAVDRLADPLIAPCREGGAGGVASAGRRGQSVRG
jgi:TPR repeat protein